ncbi:hypothetical protein [Minwuia sp.]|uniref:hypothetical protein n=1 Tax=Minwuia sp. TaxID=2493630 RepID=UPI003A9219C0
MPASVDTRVLRSAALSRLDELTEKQGWSDDLKAALQLHVDDALPEEGDGNRVQLAAAPLAAVPWLWALAFGGAAAYGVATQERLERERREQRGSNVSEARRHRKKPDDGDDAEPGTEEGKSGTGRKAQDNSKGEKHGNVGRSKENLQPKKRWI